MPDQRLKLNRFQTEAGLANVAPMTRFQDIGLPEWLPWEPVFEVHCRGTSIEDAVDRAALFGNHPYATRLFRHQCVC